MSVPTQGEEYAKFIEHIRLAQEGAYMLSHLAKHHATGSRKDQAISDGWFAVGELLKRMVYQCTKLAEGKLQ